MTAFAFDAHKFVRAARKFIPYPRQKTIRRWFPKFEERNIAFIFAELGIDTVIDVGANWGQFASKIRCAGYKGRIISFEPVSDSHRRLVANSCRDPLWNVASRMALGSSERTVQINVMKDSSLSSLLDMINVESRLKEEAPMMRLDAAIGAFDLKPDASIALKIDVQGTEQQVLDGATRTLESAKAILIEVCLKPSYVGEINYLNILNWLHERRFRAVYFAPVVNRPRLGEMYQVDVLLVRRANDEVGQSNHRSA
jgi:FkbM family methyltransferase